MWYFAEHTRRICREKQVFNDNSLFRKETKKWLNINFKAHKKMYEIYFIVSRTLIFARSSFLWFVWNMRKWFLMRSIFFCMVVIKHFWFNKIGYFFKKRLNDAPQKFFFGWSSYQMPFLPWSISTYILFSCGDNNNYDEH